jgi:hypothetical protein
MYAVRATLAQNPQRPSLEAARRTEGQAEGAAEAAAADYLPFVLLVPLPCCRPLGLMRMLHVALSAFESGSVTL